MNVNMPAGIRPNKQPTFSMVLNSNSMRQMIDKTIGDPRRASSFAATLLSVVSASEQLKQCKPESIITAALKGEGMNLSLALGHYSVVPYGDSANFQISYKGLAQLATRSGQYKDFGVFDVREGEYKGKDPRTRQPIINWMDDDERESKPLAGFYAFYELQNGFFKAMYWTHEKILNHADRYSKAFHKDIYDRMCNGKMSESEASRYRRGTPWYDEPLSEAHMKMCKKTLLIQLLGDGTAPLSIEMQEIINVDRSQERYGEVIYPDDPEVIAANQPDVITVDEDIKALTDDTTNEDVTLKASGTANRQRTAAARRMHEKAQREPEIPTGIPDDDFMNVPEDILDVSKLPFADV